MTIPIEYDHRYKVNQSIVDEMRKLRKQGLTYDKIAKKFDISHHTVYYWCNEKYRKHKQGLNAKRKYEPSEHSRIETANRRRRWKECDLAYKLDAVINAKNEYRCKRHKVFGKSIEEWDKILAEHKKGGQKVL